MTMVDRCAVCLISMTSFGSPYLMDAERCRTSLPVTLATVVAPNVCGMLMIITGGGQKAYAGCAVAALATTAFWASAVPEMVQLSGSVPWHGHAHAVRSPTQRGVESGRRTEEGLYMFTERARASSLGSLADGQKLTGRHCLVFFGVFGVVALSCCRGWPWVHVVRWTLGFYAAAWVVYLRNYGAKAPVWGYHEWCGLPGAAACARRTLGLPVRSSSAAALPRRACACWRRGTPQPSNVPARQLRRSLVRGQFTATAALCVHVRRCLVRWQLTATAALCVHVRRCRVCAHASCRFHVLITIAFALNLYSIDVLANQLCTP